ncbi:MAG: hypothetical protein RR313_11895 [Anaerovoracaceae bacterium]
MSISKLEVWKDRITTCKASGLRVPEWCQNNGVTTAQYYYWHQIINKPTIITDEPPTFVEVVALKSETSSVQGIKITCKAIEIFLSDRADIDLAISFIQGLNKQC